MPERTQDVWLAFAFLAWSGLHILLRLLSLHMCNEYLSLQKKKKKKKKKEKRAPFFLQCLMPALPAGIPLILGGDLNCVAGDRDLVGGQPGTRQHGFHSGLLPLQPALGLQDAFRHLHPDVHEFTHTATSGSSSARVDRWLVSDSLLSAVSAAAVSAGSSHIGISVCSC